MFYYVYCSLPGPKWARVSTIVAVVVAFFVLMFFVVFPVLAEVFNAHNIVYR